MDTTFLPKFGSDDTFKQTGLQQQTYFRRPKWDNLILREMRILYDLKQNKDIVIKVCDKGNAVCVVQREDYISEGIGQLSDTKSYPPVDTTLTEKYREEVLTIIKNVEHYTCTFYPKFPSE